MKPKKSLCLAIAGIIGLAYLIYLISYFSGISNKSSDVAEEIGSAIATALVMPHMIFIALAVIFNGVAFFANKQWAALVSGILYVVSGFMMFIYFIFVLPSAILAFIGCARLKKLNTPKQPPQTEPPQDNVQ